MTEPFGVLRARRDAEREPLSSADSYARDALGLSFESQDRLKVKRRLVVAAIPACQPVETILQALQVMTKPA